MSQLGRFTQFQASPAFHQAPATESEACSLDRWTVRMPRYHFNVYDGHSKRDREGVELSDSKTARREAMRLAEAAIAVSDVSHPGEEWRVDVTNDRNVLLFHPGFAITEAAVIK